jgi:hypothetical protein
MIQSQMCNGGVINSGKARMQTMPVGQQNPMGLELAENH